MPDAHDLLSDDVELVARRLEQGLDPNATVDDDTEGVTLLAVHCFLGHPPIVQQLLQHLAASHIHPVATTEVSHLSRTPLKLDSCVFRVC